MFYTIKIDDLNIKIFYLLSKSMFGAYYAQTIHGRYKEKVLAKFRKKTQLDLNPWGCFYYLIRLRFVPFTERLPLPPSTPSQPSSDLVGGTGKNNAL